MNWCDKHGEYTGTCYWCENEQLRAELDRLKRGGWVSVKERLPRSGDTVLVYYRRGDYRRMDIVRYLGHWIFIDPYIEVTHWQPLPEPPKERENG